jgi:hypothetical protein
LQRQMSQIQKESQKIRLLLSKKTFSTTKNTSTKKKSTKKTEEKSLCGRGKTILPVSGRSVLYRPFKRP